MGKKLIGESETRTLSEILHIQKDMSDLHADIIDCFVYDVDAASDARIRGDILIKIEKDFQELFNSYDSSAREVEQMADELGARFGKYGSFTKPDFESGRDAFRDLCGGEYDQAGYLYECRKKLEKYGAQTTEMIQDSGIRERMEELGRQISASDTAISGSVTTSCTGIKKQKVEDLNVTVTGAENAAEGFCRDLFRDGKALLAKIKGTDFVKKAGKIVSAYGKAYDNSDGSGDDMDRKIRASLKIGTHLLSLAAEELGSSNIR